MRLRDASASRIEATRGSDQARVDAYFETEAQTWDEIYGRSDLTGVIFQDRQRIALSFVDMTQMTPGSAVLEVGPGAGFMTLALLERGYRVDAIDTVEHMIVRTERRAAEAGLGHLLDATSGDVHALEFEDESFAAAVALGVVPWLRDPTHALEEIARVLKPGGWLVATADNRGRLTHLVDPRSNPILTPLKKPLKRALERTGVRQPRMKARQHSLKEFDQLLAQTGFERRAGMTCGFGVFTFLGWRVVPERMGLALHRKLQELAERGTRFLLSAGGHYIVLARRSPQLTSPASPQRAGRERPPLRM
jgi:ubiquinone/menaquinone biosynthesis C-methylase UbiE